MLLRKQPVYEALERDPKPLVTLGFLYYCNAAQFRKHLTGWSAWPAKLQESLFFLVVDEVRLVARKPRFSFHLISAVGCASQLSASIRILHGISAERVIYSSVWRRPSTCSHADASGAQFRETRTGSHSTFDLLGFIAAKACDLQSRVCPCTYAESHLPDARSQP